LVLEIFEGALQLRAGMSEEVATIGLDELELGAGAELAGAGLEAAAAAVAGVRT
jgi:hypothetical protein